eukprot:353059-Chlamydomonas_euryale.AAC.6
MRPSKRTPGGISPSTPQQQAHSIQLPNRCDSPSTAKQQAHSIQLPNRCDRQAMQGVEPTSRQTSWPPDRLAGAHRSIRSIYEPAHTEA